MRTVRVPADRVAIILPAEEASDLRRILNTYVAEVPLDLIDNGEWETIVHVREQLAKVRN